MIRKTSFFIILLFFIFTVCSLNNCNKTGSNSLTVYSYNNVTVGSYSNGSIGNFYAASNRLNTVNFIEEAKDSCKWIDLCYYYAVTNEATLAAPDDSDAATLYRLPAKYGLPTWPVRNATRFRKISYLSPVEFDALDSISIQNKYFTATGLELPYANHLLGASAGNQQSFIAFKTANPVKYGIIRVTWVDQIYLMSGSIIFDVKINK